MTGYTACLEQGNDKIHYFTRWATSCMDINWPGSSYRHREAIPFAQSLIHNKILYNTVYIIHTNKRSISPESLPQYMSWKVSYSRSLTVRAVGMKVGGRAPSGINHLPPHKYWIESWKQNFWAVENGCCCPCKVGVSCVNLYKSNTLFAYHTFVRSSVNPIPVKSPYLSVKQIEWPSPDRRPCSYQTRWSVTRTQYSTWAMSHHKDYLSRYGDSHYKDKAWDLFIYMMGIIILVQLQQNKAKEKNNNNKQSWANLTGYSIGFWLEWSWHQIQQSHIRE